MHLPRKSTWWSYMYFLTTFSIDILAVSLCCFFGDESMFTPVAELLSLDVIVVIYFALDQQSIAKTFVEEQTADTVL